ncbi:MT-A70 family methyltransferase [Mesorhizobium sp. LHD-90]|uniref:MT-A70 family methyltransferase n=1 Tax=Mesorhizobium sp. LHD-90 TaxID=3071414 RepID=UPI0027DFAF3E|nr:MT-A70 family methyltransferase [Mesorhizobium sp. LHD-90]MDQ6437174.1 MT-A70 family methyltransferase [Mesorhizobium sp. LHD-90]
MGRPPLHKSGAMTSAERQKRRRRKLAAERRRSAIAGKVTKRDGLERALAERQIAFPVRRYGVILADPPWRFEPYSRDTGMDRAADNHYPTLTAAMIAALDVPAIAAADCALFLWITTPMLPDGLAVLTRWGFCFKSMLTWDKEVAGTGYWFRNQTEHLLVGTRGNIPAPAPGTQWPSLLRARRGRHSQKPDPVYTLIESLFPTLPKLEMFARKARIGWESWGAEAPMQAR